MTNAETLELTIARYDAVMEEHAASEILLIDLGASAEELEAAIGPDGYAPPDAARGWRGANRRGGAVAQRQRRHTALRPSNGRQLCNPDGDVARAIRAVQGKQFDPPELDERVQPHRRMAPAR
jgi:hypothetical protein